MFVSLLSNSKFTAFFFFANSPSHQLHSVLQELPKHCHLTPGVPVQVMLGKPAKGIAAVLERFANVSAALRCVDCELRLLGNRSLCLRRLLLALQAACFELTLT